MPCTSARRVRGTQPRTEQPARPVDATYTRLTAKLPGAASQVWDVAVVAWGVIAATPAVKEALVAVAAHLDAGVGVGARRGARGWARVGWARGLHGRARVGMRVSEKRAAQYSSPACGVLSWQARAERPGTKSSTQALAIHTHPPADSRARCSPNAPCSLRPKLQVTAEASHRGRQPVSAGGSCSGCVGEGTMAAGPSPDESLIKVC